jgi:hypothetical protein
MTIESETSGHGASRAASHPIALVASRMMSMSETVMSRPPGALASGRSFISAASATGQRSKSLQVADV